MHPARALSAILVLATLAFSGPAKAEGSKVSPRRLPDWIRHAVDAAPSPARAELQWVLRETTVTPELKGGVRVRRRVVVKVLRRDGVARAERWEFRRGHDDRLVSAGAWTVGSDGTVWEADSGKDVVDRPFQGDSPFDDSRSCMIVGPRVELGAIVAYESEVVEALDLGAIFAVAGGFEEPTEVAHVVLSAPQGWSVDAIPVHLSDPGCERKGDILECTSHDVSPAERDHPRESEAPETNAPGIWLHWTSPDGTRGFADWDRVARWVSERIARRSDRSEELRAVVAHMPRPETGGLPEALRSADRVAAKGIRNLSPRFSSGGFSSQDPDAVLSRRFGDAKDKAFLLHTILSSWNLTNHPVLVRTESWGPLQHEIPTPLQFNHVIVAVEVKPDACASCWAIADAPGAGRLLFLDPTGIDVDAMIPVLDARLIMLSPGMIKFRVMATRLAPAEAQHQKFPQARGAEFYVWHWQDVPAHPVEPHMPPFEEGAKSIVVSLLEFNDGHRQWKFPATWADVGFQERRNWEEWLGRMIDQGATVARKVTEGKTTVAEKTEAVRTAVRERIRVLGHSAWPMAHDPDDVLRRGKGLSADAAGLAVAMLRSVKVPANIALFRRSSSGPMPRDLPMVRMLEDVLVVVPNGSGLLVFSPAEPGAIDFVPVEARGTIVLPLDGVAEAPLSFPEPAASDDRIVRSFKSTIEPDGTLAGEGTVAWGGVVGARWREHLRDLAAPERSDAVRDWLRQSLTGLELEDLAIENLDRIDDNLTLKFRFKTPAYATVTGKRLVVNPCLVEREKSADWTAETRVNDLDFGVPTHTVDTYALTLPDGAGAPQLPKPVLLSLVPLGRYAMQSELRGSVLTMTRELKIDTSHVDASAYPTVRRWFNQVARSDEQPVVVELP